MRTHASVIAAAVVAAMIAILMPIQSFAEPTSGFGIFAGISSTDISADTAELDASGLGVGLDYQIALQENLSLNPFLMLFHEEADSQTATVPFFGTITVEREFDYQILGLQLRFWPHEQFFVGAQVANHDVEETLTFTFPGETVSDSASESDVGFGVAAGAQVGEGLTLTAQYDTVELNGTDFETLRLLIGWRFSMP